MKNRTLSCVLAACLSFAHFGAAALSYPERPVRLVVGYSPGGGTDIIARMLATKASEALGQSVVVENRPGGSGVIAANQVVRAAPDGYTVMMGVTSLNTIQPHLQPNFPYDPIADLTPVVMTGLVPHLIVVHPSLPVKDLKGLISYLKQHPGEVNYPSAGTGTTPHLAGEIFQRQAGVQLLHVPYKSSGQALPDLISGRLTVAFDTYPAIAGAVRAGQVRAIAVAATERLPEFPDLPTATEAGLPGYTFSTWYGLFAPKDTPAPVVDRLNTAFNQALQAEDLRKPLQDMGVTSSKTSPQEFAELVKRDLERFRVVLADTKIETGAAPKP